MVGVGGSGSERTGSYRQEVAAGGSNMALMVSAVVEVMPMLMTVMSEALVSGMEGLSRGMRGNAGGSDDDGVVGWRV